VIGGGYTLDNSDDFFADDYWGVNASYYYDDKTSVSVSYNDNDFYSVRASYFINNNYSVELSYNGIPNNNNQRDWDADSYYLSFSAQF
jgi:outer membrane protein W